MYLPELNIQLITKKELSQSQIETFYDLIEEYADIVPFSSLNVADDKTSEIEDTDVLVFEQGDNFIYALSLTHSVVDKGKDISHQLATMFDFDFSLDISEQTFLPIYVTIDPVIQQEDL